MGPGRPPARRPPTASIPGGFPGLIGALAILPVLMACLARPAWDVAGERSAPTPAVVTPAPNPTPIPRQPTSPGPPAVISGPPEGIPADPVGAALIWPLPVLSPAGHGQPTLADFWAGTAHFALDVLDTGLPLGESESLAVDDGLVWSYVHRSHPAGGILDQCGNPVPFPGCVVRYRSDDGGRRFALAGPPECLIACRQCPCDSAHDHIDQQQYPDVVVAGGEAVMAYEYRGRTMLRRSPDGVHWSAPAPVPGTGIWEVRPWCPPAAAIGRHPFVPYRFKCLAGGPPGLLATEDTLYVLVGLGQNPAGLGCFRAPLPVDPATFRPCDRGPLFAGVAAYGPLALKGPPANPYFDFRTISSAELSRLGQGPSSRYYALYEGIRGPGPGDPGDSQFGLGLARTLTDRPDGPWEKFPGNPILADLPGNVGLGHADLLQLNGTTYLYTSLDGVHRSRLVLVWNP